MRRATRTFAKLRHDHRGLTLVEMIVAIVIAGILVAMVGMFGRRQIDDYLGIGNRAELADAADTALRRIARDLQRALPNSVRQSGNFLEYVPIKDAGRYQAENGGDGSDDILDFSSNTDSSFRVFGPPVTIETGDQLVVYNLGQVGADVYAGTSRRKATMGANLSSVTFAPAGTQFPLASPQNRFQVVGGPVTYECAANASDPASGQVIRHWCYDFQSSQPTAFSGLTPHASCSAVASSVLVTGVSACAFTYTPGVLQRNGLVVMRLTLTRDGESVDLLHQVDVLNTP